MDLQEEAGESEDDMEEDSVVDDLSDFSIAG